MDKQNENHMSRKEFLKRSASGLLGVGLLGMDFMAPRRSVKTQNQTSPEYRTLGRTGMRVSVVGFGASRTMEPALVRHAIDVGINFIDTGRSYFNGQNETMVGNILKGLRKNVILQSKMRVRVREGGVHPSQTESEKIHREMEMKLQQSLKALQTDYIDVMLLHDVSSTAVLHHEAIVTFLGEAKRKGQIRACGFSCHENQIEIVREVNEKNFYDTMMVTFNHKGSYVHSLTGNYSEWDQPALEKELQKAAENNLGIVAMKTCSAGPCSLDGESKPSYEAALRWIRNHSFIHSMAVAMANFDEIEENVQAMFPSS
ncbi:MAG: aldo/keto reductase [bacterium]